MLQVPRFLKIEESQRFAVDRNTVRPKRGRTPMPRGGDFVETHDSRFGKRALKNRQRTIVAIKPGKFDRAARGNGAVAINHSDLRIRSASIRVTIEWYPGKCHLRRST